MAVGLVLRLICLLLALAFSGLGVAAPAAGNYAYDDRVEVGPPASHDANSSTTPAVTPRVDAADAYDASHSVSRSRMAARPPRLAARGATRAGDEAASSAAQGARLKTHLSLAERYGAGGIRELQNGRFRYYGQLRPARTPGEMAGQRTVREWNPATGAQRTWLETLDHHGRVRIVRPETGGPKRHFQFDAQGEFIGSR
jgi:hypothetical protein